MKWPPSKVLSDDAPVCRVCGCTDSMACTWFEVRGDGEVLRHACSWVAEDLCSECARRPAPRKKVA